MRLNSRTDRGLEFDSNLSGWFNIFMHIYKHIYDFCYVIYIHILPPLFDIISSVLRPSMQIQRVLESGFPRTEDITSHTWQHVQKFSAVMNSVSNNCSASLQGQWLAVRGRDMVMITVPGKFHPRKFHPRKFHPRKFHPRKFHPRKFHPRKFHPRKFHPAKIPPNNRLKGGVYLT